MKIKKRIYRFQNVTLKAVSRSENFTSRDKIQLGDIINEIFKKTSEFIYRYLF